MTRFLNQSAAAVMALLLTFAAFDTLVTVPPVQAAAPATLIAPQLA